MGHVILGDVPHPNQVLIKVHCIFLYLADYNGTYRPLTEKRITFFDRMGKHVKEFVRDKKR